MRLREEEKGRDCNAARWSLPSAPYAALWLCVACDRCGCVGCACVCKKLLLISGKTTVWMRVCAHDVCKGGHMRACAHWFDEPASRIVHKTRTNAHVKKACGLCTGNCLRLSFSSGQSQKRGGWEGWLCTFPPKDLHHRTDNTEHTTSIAVVAMCVAVVVLLQ